MFNDNWNNSDQNVPHSFYKLFNLFEFDIKATRNSHIDEETFFQ